MPLTVLLSVALLQAAQTPCAEIRATKEKVYAFRPSSLSDTAKDAKSKELDGFWNLVQSRKAEGISCLRQLLSNEKAETFFLFNGAHLLARLDRSEASMRVIIDSIARAPLAEVEGGIYVNVAIGLSREGADITRLATRFLSHPDDKISAPLHSLTVDRVVGVLLLFARLPVERADAALIQALESSDAGVREPAAMVLAALMTEGGLKALSQSPLVRNMSAGTREEIDQARALADQKLPEGPPTFTREQVLERMRRLPRTSGDYAAALDQLSKAPYPEDRPILSITGDAQLIDSATLTLTAADLPALREWRRTSVRSLSDETLSEFFAFTRIISAVIGRFGLYAEYRIRKDH